MRQRRCPAPARRHARSAASAAAASISAAPNELVITRPDDWHLHVRDGAGLQSVVPHTAATYGRAIIMPNTVPPVTTAAAALDYRSRVLAAVPASRQGAFEPLMTCYLTDNTQPEDVARAQEVRVSLNGRKQGVLRMGVWRVAGLGWCHEQEERWAVARPGLRLASCAAVEGRLLAVCVQVFTSATHTASVSLTYAHAIPWLLAGRCCGVQAVPCWGHHQQ